MGKEVTLNPGHQKTIVFSVIPNVVSEYDVSIGSLNNQFNVIRRLKGDLFGIIRADLTHGRIGGAFIEIEGPGGNYETYSFTEPEAGVGWYEILNIVPGLYGIRVTAPDYEEYLGSVEIKPKPPKTQFDVTLMHEGDFNLVAIEEVAFATWPDPDSNRSEDKFFVRLRNVSPHTISGVLRAIHWQQWWNQPEHVAEYPFTLKPDEVYRRTRYRYHMKHDPTYERFEVVVGDVIVAATPNIYIQPGKSWLGGPDGRAELLHSGEGYAVMWYSHGGTFDSWKWYYRRPPTGDEEYYSGMMEFRCKDYSGALHDAWQTMTFVLFDPDFVGGRQYRIEFIEPRQAFLNFTA